MNIGVDYLMESDTEWDRLKRKSDAGSTRDQLVLTGFPSHQGMHAIDAGCGSGAVSHAMAGLLASTGTRAKITLIDRSEVRLQGARRDLKSIADIQIDCVPTDLVNLPLPDNSADYVFSRFVFEYLENPAQSFTELLRVTKPGGKLVIGDLDYNSMTHFPLEKQTELQLQELMTSLNQTSLLDPYIGRKLYSFFYEHKLQQIRVHLLPHHLFYGELSAKDFDNWEAKLDQLSDLQKKGVLSVGFELSSFKKDFLRFLRSPGRFSYTPLILVEGVKA